MSLYRRSSFHASLAVLLICICLAAMAPAFQRRGPHKLRATGLVEVTRDSRGKVSAVLTPITILDNGRFQDASIYKSRPRPMAIEEGIVYEAQKNGFPVGYVTLDNAQVKDDIWIAEGRWQPAPQPSEAPAVKNAQSQPPRGGNSSSEDDRPILHRGGSQAAPPPPPSSPPQAAPVPTPVPEPEPEPQDPDRPVLRRRRPSAEPSPAATPTPNSTPGAPRASRPTPTPAPVANPPGTQVLIGVSDVEPTEARSYEFHWRPQEREQIEAKMRRLALGQLPGVKGQVNQPAITNVVIRAFDVDLSNDAVVVLTAEVPGGYLATEAPTKTKPPSRTAQKRRTANPSTPPGAAEQAPPAKFVSRFITVIARIDIEGNPQKLAASVTDSSRLDVAPRLELIDAVDVDGDGLAELLFREYSFDQKSFIIYGIGHGAVTKVFEGASQALH